LVPSFLQAVVTVGWGLGRDGALLLLLLLLLLSGGGAT
jgi:hypothetical protein